MHLPGEIGVEGGRRGQETRPGRADEEHGDAAAFRELDHLAHVALGLLVAEPPQEIIATDAEQQQPRCVLVERGGQPIERLRRHFARHPGRDDAAADQELELRGIALRFRGAGAVCEAVPEGEHHRVGWKARQLRALAARGDAESENERENTRG